MKICSYSYNNDGTSIFWLMNLQVLLLGFDAKEMQWQEFLVLLWVFTFLIDEFGKVPTDLKS